MLVRVETAGDHSAVYALNQQAFGRNDEARLVEGLRAEGYARISLVAIEEGQVIGHILFSALPIVTERGPLESLALAPMAVLPSHQRQGIGSLLVKEGLRACAEAGHQIIIVLGHPEFYARFGFSARLAERLISPFAGPAFMATELVPGALADVEGEVRYPPPFGMVE